MNSHIPNNVDFTRSSDNFSEGLLRINMLNQALKKEFGEKSSSFRLTPVLHAQIETEARALVAVLFVRQAVAEITHQT